MSECFRIGVLSDTHLVTAGVDAAVRTIGRADCYVHLGDVASDVRYLRSQVRQPVYAVAGNNDYTPDDPLEQVVTLGGVRFLLTHGHRYHVKSRLDLLAYRAREAEAECALFGHTHRSMVDWVEGVLLINPGSARVGREASCAVIEIEERRVRPLILPL